MGQCDRQRGATASVDLGWEDELRAAETAAESFRVEHGIAEGTTPKS